MKKILEFILKNDVQNHLDIKCYTLHPNVNKKEKMQALVNTLRIIAIDDYFKNKNFLIPIDTEQLIFSKGEHNLGDLLYYLADMLEE